VISKRNTANATSKNAGLPKDDLPSITDSYGTTEEIVRDGRRFEVRHLKYRKEPIERPLEEEKEVRDYLSKRSEADVFTRLKTNEPEDFIDVFAGLTGTTEIVHTIIGDEYIAILSLHPNTNDWAGYDVRRMSVTEFGNNLDESVQTDNIGEAIAIYQHFVNEEIRAVLWPSQPATRHPRQDRYDEEDAYQQSLEQKDKKTHNTEVQSRWSDELIANTRQTLTNLRCMDPCHLKHWRDDHRFGTISVTDAYNGKWLIHILETADETEEFESLDDMIAAGWVLD
jgi:hypothetical protein